MNILIRWIAGLRVFFVLLIFLLIACVLGGVIPQGEEAQKYHEIFGHAGASFVLTLGLNQVFSSFWFLALLALAGSNLIACSLTRWKALQRRPGVVIAHLAIVFIFAGGIVRGLFSQHGFLPMEIGEEARSFIGDNDVSVKLPFGVKLKDFRVHYWEEEKHLVHAIRASDGFQEAMAVTLGKESWFNPLMVGVTPVRFYPNFIIGEKGPSSHDEARENPALEVKVKTGNVSRGQFLFANFPDFHGADEGSPVRFVYEYIPGKIKQFESRLAIVENGGEVLEKTIQVNSPFEFRGWRFFQSGYDPKNPNYSAIQVSRDPSAFLIYLGFGFLLLGLGWAFLAPPTTGKVTRKLS